MNFKTLAAAALLATAASASFAGTINLGTLAQDTTTTWSSAASGSFVDTITFTLSTADDVSETVGTAFVKGVGFIGSLSETLKDSSGDVVGTGFYSQLGSKSGNESSSIIASGLASGTYTLTVSGVGTAGASYTGSIVPTAAVPEPASVALMLAGLGCMGFIAKRRKQG